MTTRTGETEHWFVVFRSGQPSLQTASQTRLGAIGNWMEATSFERDWSYWYRNGMRAKRVKIKWEVRP